MLLNLFNLILLKNYHQKMRRNFVYCNCLVRYYRLRLNILLYFCFQQGHFFGSSNVFCPRCKRSYRLLDEIVWEQQTFRFSHMLHI